jgi:hypothetical protein
MNSDGDAARHVVLSDKDIEIFAKPTPKKTRALKKCPIPLRGYVSSEAAKKPRRKIAKKKEVER